MGFADFIDKTINKNRGYIYHTYQTIFDGKIFELWHYGTPILTIDLEKRKILNYYIYSQSDAQAISKTLWRFHLNKILEDYYLSGERIVRDLGNDILEMLEYWHSFNYYKAKHYIAYKCKKLFKENKLYVLQNGNKLFIFTTIEEYKNRIFWIKMNENETILCDRELDDLEKITLLNKSLFSYTTNLKEIIKRAKAIAVINAI